MNEIVCPKYKSEGIPKLWHFSTRLIGRFAYLHTQYILPDCEQDAKANRLSQARYRCIECGYENHADVVGALKVLARGLKMIEGQDTVDASTGLKTVAQIACVPQGYFLWGKVNGATRPSVAGTHRSVQERPSPCAA